MRRKTACMWLAALLIAAGGEALAHRMIAASVVREDGTVLLQAFFPDGSPARGVKARVFRPDGELFREDETDPEGRLVIRPQGPPGRWRAVFIGSMGHRTDTEFQVGPASGRGPPAAERAEKTQRDGPEKSLAAEQPVPWTRALAGLGFLFGLSALLMCIRMRSELRRLAGEEHPGRHNPGDTP